jgi:hypothetical protein
MPSNDKPNDQAVDFIGTLDLRLFELDSWIPRAGADLLTFWDAQRRDFIRETLVVAGETQPALGRTATNRALASLVDFLRYLAEEKMSDSALAGEVRDRVGALVGSYVAKASADPASVRSTDASGFNMFKDAHLVLALSVASTWLERTASTDGGNGSSAGDIRAAINSLLSSIVTENAVALDGARGARVHLSDTIHDFVTFYSVRAIDAYRIWADEEPSAWPPELSNRVERDLVAQIGYHSAGSWSQFDPGELAFQAALLDRLVGSASSHLTSRAIDLVAASQTNDGGWPSSRVISFSGRHLLHVASVEVALALATMLLNQQHRDASSANEKILPILDKTFDLIRTTRVTVDADVDTGTATGWANDRTRWSQLAESWATAIVLAFLIRYRDVVLECRQGRVLARYEVRRDATGIRPAATWADLIPVIDRPRLVDATELNISDPSDDGRLATALVEFFVNPVVSSVAARPLHASLVVPGPPGTRKTSLVKRLAGALGWPLVTMSPPTFLADGLDGFERHAAAVFRDLMRLRRAVVFFDECEDFFRKRDDQEAYAPAGSRTLGAFITAGMLPRLQALRDGGWVIFVLATNISLDQLDPAVVRPGRFDFQVTMANPTLKAQRRYLKTKFESGSAAYPVVDRALATFAATHDARSEVTWAAIDDIAAKFTDTAPQVEDVLTALVERVQLKGPPVLPAV